MQQILSESCSEVTTSQHTSNSRAAGPVYPRRLKMWTWLVKHVPFLTRRFPFTTDIPRMPDRDEAFEAKLLAALCQDETREAMLLLLQGELMVDGAPKGGG